MWTGGDALIYGTHALLVIGTYGQRLGIVDTVHRYDTTSLAVIIASPHHVALKSIVLGFKSAPQDKAHPQLPTPLLTFGSSSSSLLQVSFHRRCFHSYVFEY